MVKALEAGAPTATPVKTKKPPRSKAGAEEAKAAATMTQEQWKEKQVGMDEKWPQPQYMAAKNPRGGSHTFYRDETYEIVTRWMAETRMYYRPHAKSPGSKSHVRYEVYSQATTVGEALAAGTLPVDWCWDYERGFIRVAEDGPVRTEPVDIAQCTPDDQARLTEVDQKIYRWYNKELAKKLNVPYNELFGTSDSSILRAHRLVAQREARTRLAAAETDGRRISDEDVEATLKAWAFAKNSARTNVLPNGQDWVWSDTLGLIRTRDGRIHCTPATKYYTDVVQLLVKWLIDRIPQTAAGFRFTSLNLNYNYAARIHRDGNNFGPSFIKAFGDFSGGELNYWPEDDQSTDFDKLPEDKKEQLQLGKGSAGGLAMFNGNSAHSVQPFEGSRFSVVYFALGCHDRAAAEEVDFLRSLGIAFPDPKEDRYGLLRKPRGYGRDVVNPGTAEGQPSFMYFANDLLDAQNFEPRTLQKVEAISVKQVNGPRAKAGAAKATSREKAVALAELATTPKAFGAPDNDAVGISKAAKPAAAKGNKVLSKATNGKSTVVQDQKDKGVLKFFLKKAAGA